MRKLLTLLAVLLASGLTAAAQDAPKFEGFLGYTYDHVSPPSGVPSFGLNGGSGSISFNPIPALGIVADFGGYHTGNIAGQPVSLTLYTYMFGPKFAVRRGRFTPFAQGLFGGVHGGVSAAGFGSSSGNAFSMALGGGLDARVAQHVAIRIIQAEYLMLRDSGTTLNTARISAGVVFRFGSK
jgi:opacity protein-like surface antigen